MTPPVPSLQVNRRRATLLLIAMAALWLVLLACSRIWPEYHHILAVLTTGAEAGVVGGLADWYAITVLFRDPFKHIWTPKLIREHTEIIPRNKARIADSLGRFVQENFLAPHIVRRTVEERDVVRHVAEWLADAQNSRLLTHEFQRIAPRILKIFQNKDIEQFMQSNIVDWLHNTALNRPVSRTLKALFDNEVHHDVIQMILDAVDLWISRNPQQAENILQKVLDETGLIGQISRGVSLFGFDLKRQTIDGILRTLRHLQRTPDHPIRQMMNQSILQWTEQLQHDDSIESKQLNAFKEQFIQNPTMTGFLMQVIANLRQSLIDDLESTQSAIGQNLNGLLQRMGQKLLQDDAVRQVFNHELALLAEYAAARYANTIVAYVREQIEAWDTRFMIEKIESEVGGDLHMIRINGVVVGSMIGLFLGVVRVWVES